MSADTEKRKLECEEVCGGGQNDLSLSTGERNVIKSVDRSEQTEING